MNNKWALCLHHWHEHDLLLLALEGGTFSFKTAFEICVAQNASHQVHIPVNLKCLHVLKVNFVRFLEYNSI